MRFFSIFVNFGPPGEPQKSTPEAIFLIFGVPRGVQDAIFRKIAENLLLDQNFDVFGIKKQ